MTTDEEYTKSIRIANIEAQEYFDILDECQEEYNENWETYNGNDYGGFYPGLNK